jgi:hypothetical protein
MTRWQFAWLIYVVTSSKVVTIPLVVARVSGSAFTILPINETLFFIIVSIIEVGRTGCRRTRCEPKQKVEGERES